MQFSIMHISLMLDGPCKVFWISFLMLRIIMFLWALFCHISKSYKYHFNCVTKNCRGGCGKYNNCIDRNIPNKWYIQNKSCKSKSTIKICFFFSTGIHFHHVWWAMRNCLSFCLVFRLLRAENIVIDTIWSSINSVLK